MAKVHTLKNKFDILEDVCDEMIDICAASAGKLLAYQKDREGLACLCQHI